MHIELPKKKVSQSDKTVYEFLTDLQNIEKLMPENREMFEILDETTFKFALKGLPEIVLKLEEQIPHQKVVLGAASGKLPFTLTAHIAALGDKESEVALSFEGKFNALTAMMVKNPVTAFMKTLLSGLDKID